MPDYRSPEEQRAHALQKVRIRRVLDQAVHDGASLLAAMELGEPKPVVDQWVDRLWDGLRDALADDVRGCEDRLTAIIVLLEDRMHAETAELLRTAREAGHE